MYKNQPREIKARYDCRCHETRKWIREGETCIYFADGKRVYSLESGVGKDFLSWKYDLSIKTA